MKRVSIILAMFFVVTITLPACEDKLEEVEVQAPASEKMKDAENEHDGDPFGGR